jgi:hypothetical protein
MRVNCNHSEKMSITSQGLPTIPFAEIDLHPKTAVFTTGIISCLEFLGDLHVMGSKDGVMFDTRTISLALPVGDVLCMPAEFLA